MRASDCLVEIRDRTLARIGALPGVASWQITDTHLGLGAWEIRIPVEHAMSAALQEPGSGIVVTGPDGEFFSGPMTKTQFEATTTDARGMVKVEGVTDAIVLSDRLAYPDPSTPDPLKQGKDFDERTGPAETLMHAVVNANAGPAAPAPRRHPALILGPNLARGFTTAIRARFDKLGELLTELGAVAGLGFRVVQRGANLVFETYEPLDLRAERRWSLSGNQLAGARVAISAPSVTRPIVGGEGDGLERVFAAPTRPWSLEAEQLWGRRIESFLDQSASATKEEAERTGVAALEAEGQTKVIAEAVPMDDSAVGIDYPVGSQIAVEVSGIELGTVVSGYTIAANDEGLRVGAMLGDVSGLDADRWFTRQTQAAGRRISRLERIRELAGRTQQRAVFPSPSTIFDLATMTPPSGNLSAFAQAVLTVRIANGTNVTTMRVRAAGAVATRTHDVLELLECSGNGAFSDGNRAIPNELQLITTSSGALAILAYVPGGHTVAGPFEVTVAAEHEFSTGGAAWRPAIRSTFTVGQGQIPIGIHPTDDRFYPFNVAAASGGVWAPVASDPAGYYFRPGSLVELRGKITGGFNNTTPTNSTIGQVPPGADGLNTTKLATNEATGGVVHLSAGLNRILRVRTTGLMTLSLDGISYKATW
jgi:hypothetical protein